MEIISKISGYYICLINIPNELLEKIKKDLTLEINNKITNRKTYIYNYRIKNNFIVIPCYYFTNNVKNIIENFKIINKIYKSKDCVFVFKGKLRDYQKNTYELMKKHIDKNNKGILCLETGYGKTFLSLKLMSDICKKTLIISASVNQIDLLNQWKDSIYNFIEYPNIGLLQGKEKDIDKDIVLTTIKSLSQKNYPEEFFKGFGLVIIDECFTGSQKIFTSVGLLSLEDIYDYFVNNIYIKILSYDIKQNDYSMKKLTYAWKKTIKTKFVKINEKIVCTEEHLFLLNSFVWVKARDLKKGDNLINLKHKFIITSLEIFIDEMTVYDIEVKDNHNFVLEEGCVAHNCHHISSKTNSEALFKIGGCKKIIGISATPERIDNCDKILEQWIGPVFYKGYKNKKGLEVLVEIHKVYFEEYKEYRNIRNDICYSQMISNLITIKERNEYIKNIVIQKNNEGRTILCLSDRIEQVKLLYNSLISEIKNEDIGFYIGTQMKKEEKKLCLNKKIIIATTKSFSEGIDKEDLNTIILCCPKKHIEENILKNQKSSSNFIQTIGRILRKEHTDFNPLIVDIFDNFSVYKSQFYSRKKFYCSKNWNMKWISTTNEKIDNNLLNFKECETLELKELIL